jgi:hypothetical protein
VVINKGQVAFLIGHFVSCTQIMTNKDQQHLYKNTTTLLCWLARPVTGDLSIRIIGGLLVSLSDFAIPRTFYLTRIPG